MFADERKLWILSQLQLQQSVSVAELAKALNTSESTIRRDLQDLEEQGRLKRTHGGAVSMEVAAFEPSIQEKSVQHQAEKYAIAEAAQMFIKTGDTVILDAGSTTLQIARQFTGSGVTFITNSLAIADELGGRADTQVILLGGELRPTTGALVGPFCQQMLARLHADTLFLGTNGIHARQGVTTPNVAEAAAKAAMIQAARRVILVADHTKFGQISLVQVAGLDEIDTLITDIDAEGELRQALDEHSVEIVVAKSNR
ncbi:MAG: DeoR/GlpR family DNA-binding transcription regulator [Alicyclobacillus herbarius]|uniref:DeoR/GlpR family DNA-binding transcription regulator n=1 Tax=Alicyclobacillus herbarius TaxID=122960 RepID=UPI00235224FB|nr:DeoR/GlpR family DNA-binding transcription regulator [Alicyclobacillus herbarius]MCL6633269.1 DeoR/GlpR family DNA-binding transcription regulator [Alicyclobacillus herbarius]